MPRYASSPLTLDTQRNYLAFVEALPGATMWRHVYGTTNDGETIDATGGGRDSCAYVLSSVLLIFGLIPSVHATVISTVRALEAAGWSRTDTPIPGSIVLWDEHVGFYVDSSTAISNSTAERRVARHELTLSDGREPLAFYTHPVLLRG